MRIRNVLLSILGGGVLAFGLYNVHSLSGVTEGGALGLTLLLQPKLMTRPDQAGEMPSQCCSNSVSPSAPPSVTPDRLWTL